MQPEFEVRFLRFNEYNNVDENTYSLGERVPIMTFHKFTPYGKVLAGLGNASWLSGTAFVLTYGGGVDLKLTRRISLRAVDFEYQQWPSWRDPTLTSTNSTLKPYGASVGIGYRIF